MSLHNRTVLLVTLVLVSTACDSNSEIKSEIEARKKVVAELNAELERVTEEAARVLTELKTEKIDRNGDGEPDLYYNYEDEFVYAFYDRNFDGRTDETYKYDYDDVAISGKIDQDFDTHFETHYVFKDHSLRVELIDSNGNEVFDIINNYELGVATYSEKYYDLPDGKYIGRINYSFGYPDGPEERRPTNLTEEEFEDAREY